MISANELRIGNWVKYMGINKCLVSQISKENSVYYLACVDKLGELTKWHNVVDAFNPIPLTPKILEGCGFVKLEYFKGIPTGVYERSGVRIGLDGDDFIKDQYTVIAGDIRVKLQNLHQLQNLYFALTGTELNIQL